MLKLFEITEDWRKFNILKLIMKKALDTEKQTK